MADWKSDQEVLGSADVAARKVIDCFNNDHVDVWLGPPEHYPGGGGDVLWRSWQQDATDVTSLDPQRIIDEFERMRSVGRAISPAVSADLINAVKTIDYSLQDWQGDGAEAFQLHVSKIEAFIGQQSDYVARTLASLGGLLAVAVQVRRDYCALAESTVAAAQKAMGQTQDADTTFGIGVGTGLASFATHLTFESAPITGAVDLAITTAESLIAMSVEGDKSDEVLAGYTAARNQLLENYKAELGYARAWVDRVRVALAAEKNDLFEPLPPTIDVNSPDFTYRDFCTAARDLELFGDKVGEEHRKSTSRHGGFVNPDSLIKKRLEWS